MTLKKARFTEKLIEANGMDPHDFKRWVFCPGMLFNSVDKWWGDYGRRDFTHEGIDLCLYQDPSGRTLRIDEKTRIPLMHDGVVRALFTDYLGQAVIIEHEHPQAGDGTYLSVYAHTKPLDGIQPGVILKAGDVIATIADTSRTKAKILPHLHFTMARPSPGIVYEPFVWEQMRNPDMITLLDPMRVLDWPCSVLDDRPPYCSEL